MNNERKTIQKDLVIEYLKNNRNKHISIQEIYEELQNKVGMTTIYRIINNLIQKGIVKKIPLENKQGFCYMYNSEDKECQNHYHLICENCNKLFHFETSKMLKLKNDVLKNENFEIDRNKIVFYGLCKECKVRS